MNNLVNSVKHSKDLQKQLDLIHEALAKLEQSDYVNANADIDAVLSIDPENNYAKYCKAIICIRWGNALVSEGINLITQSDQL